MVVNEEDLTGKQVSNYKIVGKLGRGGMATVYKAHELSLNRVVALKVLSHRLSEDKDYIKRFQREAQAAARLNHPNIVQIFAIGEENGIHYFAMEYIKGKSLAEIKHKEGGMDPGKAAGIIKQVAAALAQAHGAGLVHRDIKPSNIMIDAAGRARVTDFGIAYVSSAQTKLTREGSIIGTPEYLSPEQCEGKTVDPRSDIYSLGVTFYELITGKTPYEADTPVSMLMKIVKGDFPPLRDVNPGIPASLRDIVEKMMQTDPQKRYGSMEIVIEALEAYEKPVPGPAVKAPATITYREIEAQQQAAAGTANKSSKWAAVVVAAVIVLLMGGAFAAKIFIFDKKEPAAQQSVDTGQTGETETGADPGAQIHRPGDTVTDTDTDSDPAITETGETAVTDTAVTGDSGITVASRTGAGSNISTTTGAPQNPPSQKTRITAPRKPLPPANSCLITAVGDEDKAGLVTPYIQEILARRNFTIIDGPSVPEREIAEIARNHIVVTVRQLGTASLNYYGNTSQQYTVRVTIKVVDPKTGRVVSGPASETVEYTSLNAEENLREAVAKLIARIRI